MCCAKPSVIENAPEAVKVEPPTSPLNVVAIESVTTLKSPLASATNVEATPISNGATLSIKVVGLLLGALEG